MMGCLVPACLAASAATLCTVLLSSNCAIDYQVLYNIARCGDKSLRHLSRRRSENTLRLQVDCIRSGPAGPGRRKQEHDFRQHRGGDVADCNSRPGPEVFADRLCTAVSRCSGSGCKVALLHKHDASDADTSQTLAVPGCNASQSFVIEIP